MRGGWLLLCAGHEERQHERRACDSEYRCVSDADNQEAASRKIMGIAVADEEAVVESFLPGGPRASKRGWRGC